MAATEGCPTRVADIAAEAHRVGRQRLATRLLDLEPRASQQVPCMHTHRHTCTCTRACTRACASAHAQVHMHMPMPMRRCRSCCEWVRRRWRWPRPHSRTTSSSYSSSSYMPRRAVLRPSRTLHPRLPPLSLGAPAPAPPALPHTIPPALPHTIPPALAHTVPPALPTRHLSPPPAQTAMAAPEFFELLRPHEGAQRLFATQCAEREPETLKALYYHINQPMEVHAHA